MLKPCFFAPSHARGACLPVPSSLLRSIRAKAPIGRSANIPGRLSLTPHLVSRRWSLVGPAEEALTPHAALPRLLRFERNATAVPCRLLGQVPIS
jgi:hypothetical protein